MNAPHLLTRLQDASAGGPLDRLAALIVEHELAQPLETLLPPARLVRALQMALEGWLASDSADRELTELLDHLQQRLLEDKRTVREALPPELAQGLTRLVTRPYSPDRTLVLTVLDRPPVRTLVRGLLVNVLLEFSRKLSAPVKDNRIARGLTGLAKLAADQARGSGGALGGIAGALSDELERQVEKRARDFADSALSGLFQQAADSVCDPSRAAEQAELRVALLDGVLSLPLARLGRELTHADLPQGVSVIHESLSRWLSSQEGPAQLEQGLTRLMKKQGGRPVREVLEALGLLTTFQQLGREALRDRLQPIVVSEPFVRWLEELMREPPAATSP